MTPQEFASLKSEIDSDPESLGYHNPDTTRKPHKDVLLSLNTPRAGSTKRSGVITRNDVLKFLARESLLPVFYDVGRDRLEGDLVKRSIGLAAMQLFSVETFDLDDSDNQSLINGAVAKDLMTPDQRTRFLSLGDMRIGRAETVMGRPATFTDVERTNRDN